MLRQAQRPALPLEKTDIDTVLAASDLDWSETDPSILGTCSSAGSTLASARSATGCAGYTVLDPIMLLRSSRS